LERKLRKTPTNGSDAAWSGWPTALWSGVKAEHAAEKTPERSSIEDEPDAVVAPTPASTAVTMMPARARSRNHNTRTEQHQLKPLEEEGVVEL
jgi:hypothetical protein